MHIVCILTVWIEYVGMEIWFTFPESGEEQFCLIRSHHAV
jgi:hypothetical protein